MNLQQAYRTGDWDTIADAILNLNIEQVGLVFYDRFVRAAFGQQLRELGCTCNQVCSIEVNADGVGCEVCKVVLFGFPFATEDSDV